MDGVKLTRNQDSKLTFSELRMTFIGWYFQEYGRKNQFGLLLTTIEPSGTFMDGEQEFDIEIEESLLQHK